MILGLIEHEQGKLNELSLEMLTLARVLAGQLGQPLHALVIGRLGEPLVERLAAYGVSAVHLVGDERLDDFIPAAWAACAVQSAQALEPEAVLAAGSDRGNEWLAHVAAQAGLPMAANCVEVTPGEAYQVTRVRWGGSLLEEARIIGAPKLLTIAPHALPAAEAPAAGDMERHAFAPVLGEEHFRVRVVSRTAPGAGKVSLAEARVVVGGGRGVGSAEGFQKLEELAGLLGGTVGCSRAVTSLGWRPHLDQVGQTGTRIAPDIYIACGISGAIQHMVGCKAARRLLAINTDPDSPIVAQADYAIIGDLHQVVPAISATLRQARGG